MAGGLNAAFRTNPSVFMGSHRIIVKCGGIAAYFSPGIGDFDLVDSKSGNPGACFVETWKHGWHRWGSAVRAFMLYANANTENQYALPTTVNYMLTNDLSGCQFLAYGPSRDNLTVEHNNYLNLAAGAYIGRAAVIAGQGHAVMLALRPVAGLPANQNEYQSVMGANVVGQLRGDGWHFYVRRDTTQANAPVYELP